VARPFDGAGHRALMLCAIAGNASADDLPFFGKKFREPFDVLVVNEGNLFAAETAKFFPEKTSAARRPLSRAPGCVGSLSCPQNGTSSSGESSSLEISMGPSFFGVAADSPSIGSSGSWIASATASREPRPKN